MPYPSLDPSLAWAGEHPVSSHPAPSPRAGRASRDTGATSSRNGTAAADPSGKPAAPPQPTLRVVRVTRPEDIIRLVGTGREFHGESRYAHVPFSEAKFVRAYERLVIKPDTTLGVFIERDGEIVGAMSAEIGDYFLGTGYPIATNHFIYVPGRHRGTALGGRVAAKLMRLFIDWARAKGARELNVHVTSGIHPERTDKFMKRLGLQPYGGNYAARLA